ncbi:MAG: sigma-70 family RNA polymerase sigma factor [Nannocystis sp.]|uniref:RNA polymerase sigma factor n=1 Tax=Nannocystis sp. TaxID=1962667 RepID=UPI00242637F6|nr:sigma-70 family RNA polymerase sigma factor [Nannocystis sp.]MBK9755552.1 sigma-70 family RNA polymerase sigma factor [Nannocystis sp.]
MSATTTVDAPPRAAESERVAMSLAEVYRAHVGFVWRVLRRLGVADAALEDVVHDVFLVVHRRLAEFDGRAALTTWLFGIARGVASNHRRGVVRAQRKLSVAPSPGGAPDPEQRTEQQQLAAFVRGFLAGLDEDRRLLFELADLEGLKVPEIAETLGMNLNTAYARLRAVREQLSRALADREAGPRRSMP